MQFNYGYCDKPDCKMCIALKAKPAPVVVPAATGSASEFYISENQGFPQRNAGHTAFTNIPTIVNPAKGSVLVFVYDGPTPAAGYSQGFCFGAFFFDGSEWQYQTPHDPGHGNYDPPTSELDALGTSVVGAYYNGPLLTAVEAINWKAPANSYVIAWAGSTALHILTYHKGDGSKDREIECPYPTGVTKADMPKTKVFRSELPATI